MRNIRFFVLVFCVLALASACDEMPVEEVVFDANDIEFEEFSTRRSTEFDKNLDISICLRLPKSNGNEMLDRIYADLVAYYTDNSKREIQSGIEIFADSIEAEYYALKEDIGADIANYICQVVYYDSIWPVFADGKLLVYYDYVYNYEGGTQDYKDERYWVFNIETGKRITEKDIFVMNDDNKKALSELIKNALAEEFYSEKKNIFAEGKTMMNSNFRISTDSLFYLYMPYEIDPFATDPLLIGLSKDDLKSYLKQDGPLYEYWYPEKKKK